jgi:hypothetical protein
LQTGGRQPCRTTVQLLRTDPENDTLARGITDAEYLPEILLPPAPRNLKLLFYIDLQPAADCFPWARMRWAINCLSNSEASGLLAVPSPAASGNQQHE